MGAVAGGMLASAVLKVVFKQICAVIGGQIKLQQDFAKDLLKMKMTLESLAAVLKDAERKSVDNSSVQLWLKRLKNAMYDISDMLEEFETDTQPAAPKKSFKKGI
ncbi:putative disease resistance protein RGA4 [Sorghum bicolor]|uniref:putative disease resistance protein RGA4 n=1 Tax=Sorghum bicolor TaxID=4558 RepID=UPI000B4264C3|nr:putative disease resistance protein RGA4 [Sorghum bicolor]|eukprot:XP_021320801.1 putative disease resistance protein RGA4 [Sorghum bicolor]